MRRAWLRSVVAWQPPGAELSGAPDARFLPPLVRRRCDDLTRAMLHVANACAPADALAQCACVFASRHASLSALVELLGSLAAGRPLSPNTFSHSVHNAPAGVFSVWASNRNACSSVAAGRESFVCGLLEALCLLDREPARDVLLVCGDEYPLAPLTPQAGEPAPTHAVAVLLTAGGEGEPLALRLRQGEGETQRAEPDEMAFARWWESGGAALELTHSTRVWRLSRGGTELP